MFGYLIPRNYMEAMQFDSENKNSKWYDAIKMEMESMREYKVFTKWDKAILDKHQKVTNLPKGYHRIKVHLVFAVKFDGRHKARLVADGHLTPEPIENIYAGVVSLRNLRLVIFLGKLNHLELWGADIGNAYLEAFTDEKLYIVAGPEFQELEGYIIIFLKAWYGLKSAGKRWAEVIHGILRDMKFLPSKADPCIWLRKAPTLRCYWIQSAYNLSDMLSKHWDHPTVYPMVLKLLITRGNITLIPREARNFKITTRKIEKKGKSK